MTGHNHYPDCTCGWCVNHGRTRINRAELQASYRVHEARNFLDMNGARSIAGCYINPNARCPVCGAAVFFYANAFGSRVYFDDLGPPWHKHPCTDNPNKRIENHPVYTEAPRRRAAGITQELIEAARKAGAFHAPANEGGRWHLLIVVTVERRGMKNTLVVEHLATDDAQQASVICHSDQPIFEIGDFLSRQGDRFSFFDKATMSPASFNLGGPVTIDIAQEPAPTPSMPAPEPTRLKPSVNLIHAAPKPARTYDMTRKEMAHFHSKHRSVQQLCDDMLPVVRAYARDGFRKPRQVAEMLNRDGHRTVLGAKWTPRLTYFLLGLMFLPATKASSGSMAVTPAGTVRAEKVSDSMEVMTIENIAIRLSRLGRVVVKE